MYAKIKNTINTGNVEICTMKDSDKVHMDFPHHWERGEYSVNDAMLIATNLMRACCAINGGITDISEDYPK